MLRKTVVTEFALQIPNMWRKLSLTIS